MALVLFGRSHYRAFKWGLCAECYKLLNGSIDLDLLCPWSGGAVSMAHRGGEYTSAMLDWMEPAAKTGALVLATST